jgi:hypothetical protein
MAVPDHDVARDLRRGRRAPGEIGDTPQGPEAGDRALGCHYESPPRTRSPTLRPATARTWRSEASLTQACLRTPKPRRAISVPLRGLKRIKRAYLGQHKQPLTWTFSEICRSAEGPKSTSQAKSSRDEIQG